MPNAFDHRQIAQDSLADFSAVMLAALAGSPNDGSDMPLVIGNVTAGAGAGTTPPASVLLAGSNSSRGNITFGSGTTPGAGLIATILFPFPKPIPRAYVFLTPSTQLTAGLQLAAVPTFSGQQMTGFQIFAAVAPAGSQGATVYGVNYLVLG